MYGQLNQIRTQAHAAQLHRAAEQHRLATKPHQPDSGRPGAIVLGRASWWQLRRRSRAASA
jgi:hypothetical protein